MFLDLVFVGFLKNDFFFFLKQEEENWSNVLWSSGKRSDHPQHTGFWESILHPSQVHAHTNTRAHAHASHTHHEK